MAGDFAVPRCRCGGIGLVLAGRAARRGSLARQRLLGNLLLSDLLFSCLLSSDPRIHILLELVEWQRAVAQHDVVILLHVELVAEALACALAQLLNFELTDFVAERLAW